MPEDMFRKSRSRPVTTGQYSFSLCGSPISYILKRSTRSRYLRLEIKHGIGLIVVAPQRCSQIFIEDFIQKKQSWILKHVHKSQNTLQRTNIEICNGSVMNYLGRKVNVVINSAADKPDMVWLEHDRLMVNLKSTYKKIKTVVEAWYRFNAEALIREKLVYWSAKTGIEYRNYKLRGQKTRWGSCSRGGKLSFNWKLVMTPEEIIDYVIIHELAHLKEMNHSYRFWALVASYCPEYKLRRKWLRDQDYLLAA